MTDSHGTKRFPMDLVDGHHDVVHVEVIGNEGERWNGQVLQVFLEAFGEEVVAKGWVKSPGFFVGFVSF